MSVYYGQPSRAVVPAPAKAMLGVGAAALQTQPMAPWWNGTQVPQRLMRAAAKYWLQDPWVRQAEKVISGNFSTVDWHLEDGEDTEVDDEYPDARYQVPRELLEHPQAKLAEEDRQVNASTRRDLWYITSRHMGICGAGFWYLDQLEPTAKTPLAILYIQPWRMWPSFTRGGNLTGWVLDWNEETQSGTPLFLDQVIQFNLEPPDEGAFAPGLVQSAMALINLDSLAMGHAASVLTAGGRLAGIVSAKDSTSALPDDKFQQLVRDFRTINELPDAARRTNIVQGPIDFNRTAATLSELELIPLMAAIRDDLLALWGVPFSQVGGTTAAGMNSGDIRKYDEAALWQNAIHPRLVGFQEALQYRLLDRYQKLGITVELEIDEPEFDDDGPRYDLLQKASVIPMRTVERRALVGLEPFGDPVLDNEIYMPMGYSVMATAPDADGNPVSPAMLGSEGPMLPMQAPEQMQLPAVAESLAKAAAPRPGIHASLVKLRTRIDRQHTAELRTALVGFLDAQKRDIASRLRANAEHIARKPKETDAWFATARWNRELAAILARPLTAMAQNVNEHIAGVLPKRGAPVKAAPAGVVDRALDRGAARITKINDRTRQAVQDFIIEGLEEGLSPAALADRIEAGVLLENGMAAFDELRAETIARTELMDAYNGAALGSYSDAGIEMVQAIDGDGDEECADRNGREFTVLEADLIEDHPNGTLDWVPVIPDDSPVKAAPMPVINITNNIPIPMRTIIERDEYGRVSGHREVFDGD